MLKTLTPTISIALAIVIVIFFTKPMLSEIGQVKDQIREYENTSAEYNKFNEQLDELEELKNSVSVADHERIAQMVPDQVDVPRLLVDLEEIARSNSVLFGNIVVENGVARLPLEGGTPESDLNALSTTDVKFEIIGTYENIKTFIGLLSESTYFMEITELSLLANSDRFQQFSVTVQLYSLIDNQ